MKFDINNVYTSVNADKLSVGDTVVLADDMRSLRRAVESNSISTLARINTDIFEKRFNCQDNGLSLDYALAYLVKEEKKFSIGEILKEEDSGIEAAITAINDGEDIFYFIAGDWVNSKFMSGWKKTGKRLLLVMEKPTNIPQLGKIN